MELIKITNLKQASFYIKMGVKPIDVDYTNRLVFIFRKDDTKDVWKYWCENYIII